MAQVYIEVSTSLKRLKGCQNGGTMLEISSETIVREILDRLGVVPGEVGLIILNGSKADIDSLVRGGDKIELYPVFGGG